jgi:hypothetical protein
LADQAGAGGDSDSGEIGQAKAGFAEGPGDQPIQPDDMGAGGDLRHDAAIGRMLRLLAQEWRREDPPLGVDQRCRGLVAAGLDPEDYWNGQACALC